MGYVMLCAQIGAHIPYWIIPKHWYKSHAQQYVKG